MNMTRKTIVNLACMALYLYVFFLFSQQITGPTPAKERENYDCQAAFTLETSDLKMPVVAGISVKDSKGVIIFGGPMYRDNILIGSISRRVEFDYTEEYSCTAFKHCKTIKFEKDNVDESVAKEILPGFFTSSDTVSYFKIHKLKGGILFKKDNVPMFYCAYQ